MPRQEITPADKIESVVALTSIDASTREIAELTDLAKSTVIDVLAGKHGWRERLKDPSFAPFRASIKRKLQAAGLVTSAKALLQAEAQLGKASAYQAAGIYGLLRDHERKDAGEATAHVAVLNRHEIASRSEALRNLLTSMGIDTNDMDIKANGIRDGHVAQPEAYPTSHNEYPKPNT